MQNKLSISKIRQMGYEAGVLKATELIKNNTGRKTLLAVEAPCQRKEFMALTGVGRSKALRFSMTWGFGFDKGIRDTVFA